VHSCKGIVHQKLSFCHHLFTLSFQTSFSLFLEEHKRGFEECFCLYSESEWSFWYASLAIFGELSIVKMPFYTRCFQDHFNRFKFWWMRHDKSLSFKWSGSAERMWTDHLFPLLLVTVENKHEWTSEGMLKDIERLIDIEKTELYFCIWCSLKL